MRYHNITKDDMLNGDGLIFDGNALNEIDDQLGKKYISGITLSGGDPLFEGNRRDILVLCKYIRELFPNKNIWLYTGYTYEEVSDLEIMDYIDILVDGPYVEKLRDTSLKWRGSSNQRVIDIKETHKIGRVVLWCD